MKAIEIKCPACSAGPNEKCIDVGHGDEKKNKSGSHVSRASAAHYRTIGEKMANNAAKKGRSA